MDGWNRLRVQLDAGGARGRCRGRAGTVTVDERGDQPSVDVARDGGVVRLRGVAGDGFVALPVALQLVTVLV